MSARPPSPRRQGRISASAWSIFICTCCSVVRPRPIGNRDARIIPCGMTPRRLRQAASRRSLRAPLYSSLRRLQQFRWTAVVIDLKETEQSTCQQGIWQNALKAWRDLTEEVLASSECTAAYLCNCSDVAQARNSNSPAERRDSQLNPNRTVGSGVTRCAPVPRPGSARFRFVPAPSPRPRATPDPGPPAADSGASRTIAGGARRVVCR